MESLPVGLDLESTVQAQPNSPPSFYLLLTGGVLDAPAASMVADAQASPIPRLPAIDKDLLDPLANPSALITFSLAPLSSSRDKPSRRRHDPSRCRAHYLPRAELRCPPASPSFPASPATNRSCSKPRHHRIRRRLHPSATGASMMIAVVLLLLRHRRASLCLLGELHLTSASCPLASMPPSIVPHHGRARRRHLHRRRNHSKRSSRPRCAWSCWIS